MNEKAYRVITEQGSGSRIYLKSGPPRALCRRRSYYDKGTLVEYELVPVRRWRIEQITTQDGDTFYNWRRITKCNFIEITEDEQPVIQQANDPALPSEDFDIK